MRKIYFFENLFYSQIDPKCCEIGLVHFDFLSKFPQTVSTLEGQNDMSEVEAGHEEKDNMPMESEQ